MKKGIIFLTSISLILILIFSGCSLTNDEDLDLQNDELCPVSSLVIDEQEASKLNDKIPVHLYFSNEDGTKLVKEIRFIPMSDLKKSENAVASVIVNEIIKGPQRTSCKKTIPDQTALRAPVKIEARVATVDLTSEFVDNHPGGKEQEELTIYSIVNSLTELKEIEKVNFLVNGKTQKEFKGNFKFDSEFPRNEALIDKNDSPTEATFSNSIDLDDEEELLE